MFEYLVPAVLLTGAFVAACVLVFVGVGGLQSARKFPDGLLQYYFYAIIFSNAFFVLLSTRDYTAAVDGTQEATITNPLVGWAIRLTSFFALLASADQITRYFVRGRKLEGARVLLGLCFIVFWLTNILVPFLFAPHKMPIQLNWSYSLVVGLGMIFMASHTGALSILHCRNAIFIFCALSLLLVPIRPDLVLQFDYSQGYLPGVPRFAGLAPHAIIMGMNAALGLWCLIAHPMNSRVLNRVCWGIGLMALILAQSKTVWFSFLLTLPVMVYCQHQLPSWGRLTASRHRSGLVLLGALVLAGIAVATGVLLFGNLGGWLDRFLGSQQGAQVLSFTGRDQIWAIALTEWERSPVFGYGLSLFDAAYRAQIGMTFAIHGHNQLIDSLGRTGTLGGIGTLLYSIGLLWLGIRFARSSRGLSAALALSIAIRMVSEIPITLGNIGIDSLPYYLLLAVIAAGMGKSNARAESTHA